MILHVDGDAFFASCEVAQNERLRGKPVVTGRERGIAIAVSYEAKALGVSRGMPIFHIKKNFPSVIVTSSSYQTYKIYAERMYTIVRRYTPYVEEYSIDECFADISSLDISHIQLIKTIQADLRRDLGMSFSLGIAPTKVLAKVASTWNKPGGAFVIIPSEINEYLTKTPIGKIWNIGPRMSLFLQKQGIMTALEYTKAPPQWVSTLSKPYRQLWHELRGDQVFKVHIGTRDAYKSMMKTATFRPPTHDTSFLLSEISNHIEALCTKLRHNKLCTTTLHIQLKTQSFHYYRREIKLSTPTQTPEVMMRYINQSFMELYKSAGGSHTLYRATGVVASNLKPKEHSQGQLFPEIYCATLNTKLPTTLPTTTDSDNDIDLYTTIDKIQERFGKDTIRNARGLISRDSSTYDEKINSSVRFGFPWWQ